MNRMWKLPWNPNGYDFRTYTIDTSGNKVGDIIPLEHTFFSSNGLSVVDARSASLIVSDTNPKADILMAGYQDYLSKVSDSQTIYKRLIINSNKAIGILDITIMFIADELDPEDIGQKVNMDSDVTHNSLDALYLLAVAGSFQFLKVEDCLNLPKEGYFNDLGSKIGTPTLQVQNTTISQSSIDFAEDEAEFKTKKSKIGYSAKSDSWYRYSSTLNRNLPLLSISDVHPTPSSFVVVNPNDPSTLKCINWIKPLHDKEGVSIPNIETKEIVANNYKLGSFNLTLDHDGNLSINDMLKINKESNEVSIGSIVFNKELLELLSYMRDLKNRGV